MKLATLYTRALSGIQAPLVRVEVHLANGLPALSIVGLPEAAVRESKDRVRAAILNSHFEFPARRITVNLAPADLPKQGGRYDLPIALGILAASGQIQSQTLERFELHGELALSGAILPVKGILPVVLAGKQAGRQVIVPAGCAAEAALLDKPAVLAATDLLGVCQHIQQHQRLPVVARQAPAEPRPVADMADVRGQHLARRALEVAAAGRHNLLMVGPPGTGKSMLASRLPGILPAMTEKQALECAAIHSIGHQGFNPAQWKQRPFRAPHHTCSGIALVGGGSRPMPGEISLAHHGVLFLDELTEYQRHVLDVLREPMETGTITISRASQQAEFPARFQLIAAMNPCPQGYHCDGRDHCQCSAAQQQRHRSKLSAPFLDRIDIHIDVPRLPHRQLDQQTPAGEGSDPIRARVEQAYRIQLDRQGHSNAELTIAEIERFCRLRADGKALLDNAMDRLALSARAYHRILKLARTIADLDSSEAIGNPHLTEAINYRCLDRGRE